MTSADLEFITTFDIEVAAPLEAGAGRRMIPVLGGTVRGPRLNGVILGGADWQHQESPDVLRIGGRWIMETDDRARIEVETPGIRRVSAQVLSRLLVGEEVDPSQYYFRVAPRFRSESSHHRWLQDTMFVGLGAKQTKSVKIDVFAVM